jgi:hypothetical protein
MTPAPTTSSVTFKTRRITLLFSGQVRDIEAVCRMLHAVMLEAVAELEVRNVAASTGFGTTKRLLAGMLQLSATEAGMRVIHATQLSARRTLSGELRWRERRDGRLGFEGFLESEYSATFRSFIERLAAPRPAAEGIPDPRTAVQRNADALVEVCGLARAAQACPTTGGQPPHLSVTLDWEVLRTGLGSATLDYGTHLSASEARRWACEAKIIPVMLGGASEPLDVGRAMRTVPLPIRRALIARDQGCAFPGCDRPPGLCQAHHCQHWADGGETSMENCVLLCETHHRHVHCTGWEILIHPDHINFIPPATIDPDRRPLHNPLRC